MDVRLLPTMLLLLTLAVPAWANPCALPEGEMPFASGVGGTGITPHGSGMGGTGVIQNDSGMGGTGILPHGTGMGGTGRTAQGAGMGGTGILPHGTGMGGTGSVADGSGMGGTGVVGIITGFGSICVNGLEIHYDANTPVSVDGRSGSPKQLAIGQWVAVQAAGVTPELKARRIELNSAAVGPVEWAAPAGDSFRVLGQSVRVMAGGKAPRVGEFVRVNGMYDENGTIQATNIKRLPATASVSVSGIVKAVSGKTVRIGGLTAVDATGLTVGEPVRLSGRLIKGGVLDVRQVEVAPEMRSVGKVDRMVLQGIVHKSDTNGISLGYARVETSAGVAKNVEPGQWVRVEVMRRPDGRLDAERWLIDSPRAGRDVEVRRGGREHGQERDASGHERESSDSRHDGVRSDSRESRDKMDRHEKRPEVEKGREIERLDKPEKVDVPEQMAVPERPERVERRDD